MDSELPQRQKANKLPQIVATLAACCGAFALGTGLAWTSPTLVQIAFDDKGVCASSKNDCFLTANEASWVGGIFVLGCLVSSFATGYLMALIGRKWTMIAMSAPFIVGLILLTLCGPLNLTNAWWFYIGRLLSGFGGGCFALAAPIYSAETSEVAIRGALGSCMQLLMTMGGLFSHGVGALIDWDLLTGISIIFPVLGIVIMIFMPETPLYLIGKGKETEARQALQWLRGKDYNIDIEFRQLQETHAKQEQIGTVAFKEFVTKGMYWKPALIMLALMFFQQFAGINAVIFYLTTIFERAHTDLDSGVSATIVASVQVMATGIAVLLVERCGRRVLLITSAAVMCVSIMGLGTYFYIDEETIRNCTLSNVPCEGKFDESLVESLSWLPLTSLMIYIFFFSIGFGPLPWMMNGELFSLEARSLAASISTAFNWLCAFIVSTFETSIEGGLHVYGAYYLYSVICAIGVVFVFFFVPDTSGRRPEEMKAYFAKPTNPCHRLQCSKDSKD